MSNIFSSKSYFVQPNVVCPAPAVPTFCRIRYGSGTLERFVSVCGIVDGYVELFIRMVRISAKIDCFKVHLAFSSTLF
jgi:hypothetical protein